MVSELMDMGYFMYYPMIAAVVFFYFFCRYREFERISFVMLASFFIYYVIFIYVPVAGPTFYFDAVGVREITKEYSQPWAIISTPIPTVCRLQATPTEYSIIW